MMILDVASSGESAYQHEQVRGGVQKAAAVLEIANELLTLIHFHAFIYLCTILSPISAGRLAGISL